MAEGPTGGEVERAPVEIADTTAGLLDEEHPGRVVPDLLAVVGAGRQPGVHLRLAACEHPVLRLRVHPHRRRRHAPLRLHLRRLSVGAVA